MDAYRVLKASRSSVKQVKGAPMPSPIAVVAAAVEGSVLDFESENLGRAGKLLMCEVPGPSALIDSTVRAGASPPKPRRMPRGWRTASREGMAWAAEWRD
ncbi:hypothetical protein CH256_22140 [Rhodococcus sp. 05-2254-6]|uniref:hypothetical protein n=1 Tax=Rhodococcus sp. 05-2254-6 TaxID=2022489 RepID=UPI000B9BECC3|nr:hypothetical protein [Rhodococcus sp. 05-2254-6]OZE22716.1 hypothetical protein CH256_22140 [Rhodococcus sp. 05-2254-6]